MPKEIERKFLLNSHSFLKDLKPELLKQAYVFVNDTDILRIRIFMEKAYLCLKTKGSGFTRDEYEYEIPLSDALEIFENNRQRSVIKNRYTLTFSNKTWVIDEFLDRNKGLFLAEIELEDESEKFDMPDWLGEEVSCDPKYFNSFLAENQVFKN